MSQPTDRRTGRPRDTAVDQRVLDAAWDLLHAAGYSGLSIDEVGARAGTAKTTLYRRWPTKDHLAVAVAARILGDVPTASTGDVRRDLTDFAAALAESLNRIRLVGQRAEASCTAIPTTTQRQAAVRLVDASWRAARKYQSLAVARAAGYRPITPTGAPVVHYLSTSAYLATVLGSPVLNLAEPQSLVYANTPKGAVLVAAMYITTRRGATPQPGGCLTQWHVHTNMCCSAASASWRP